MRMMCEGLVEMDGGLLKSSILTDANIVMRWKKLRGATGHLVMLYGVRR